MSDFRVDQITNRVGDAGTQITGITTFSGTSGMIIPSGPTEMRGGRGRGVFGSGATPSGTNVMDLITIATTGNSTDFGDDHKIRQENYASFSSSIRGINAGGYNPAAFADIHYFTFSSQGSMNDFGDLRTAVYSNAGCGNNVRGLSGGGTIGSPTNPHSAAIEYVNIASTGNASVFGSLVAKPPHMNGASYLGSGIASPTRGMWHGGNAGPDTPNVRTIEYVTISTLGDAVNFGEMTKRNAHTGCSNSTRGLIAAGQNPSNTNIIEYITIATEGDATDFGDVSATKDYLGSCASSIRGVFAGGQTPTKINVIEYVTMSTTGNTTDFGDLTVARRFLQGCSDVHGGLG